MTENIFDPSGQIIASARFDDGNAYTEDPYADSFFFYHYDKRGSTTAIVQPDGNLVKGYTYDEFGNLEQSGEEDFLNDVTFTGSVSDTSTGLQYMNSRYYNPETGRFLSQDTYSGNAYEPWTQHLYSYCGNNPTNFIDPTGHMRVEGSQPGDYNGKSAVVQKPKSKVTANGDDDVWAEYTRRSKQNIDAIWAHELGADLGTHDGRAKVISAYLAVHGWSKDATSAVLGNFDLETKWTLDPGTQQGNGSGYGLAQWTGLGYTDDGKPKNRQALNDYIDEKGYARDSICGQLEFLMYSMQSGRGQWKHDTRDNGAYKIFYLSPENFISGDITAAKEIDPSPFEGLSNVQALTRIFYHSYERSNGGWNEGRYWQGN